MNKSFLIPFAVFIFSQTACQKAALTPGAAERVAAPFPVSASPSAPATPVIAPEPSQDQDADERRMLMLINQHRADYQLQPLKLQRLLIRSARWLSQDMAARSYLSHTDSLGRDSFQRMDEFGFGLQGWRGENIACGNGGADETYQQWLSSPGHNANMLKEEYTRIGIARAYDETSKYGWYWTTDFGSD